MKAVCRNPHMTPLTERAFSQLYGETRRPLRRYVYRITGNTADADDIVQDLLSALAGGRGRAVDDGPSALCLLRGQPSRHRSMATRDVRAAAAYPSGDGAG